MFDFKSVIAGKNVDLTSWTIPLTGIIRCQSMSLGLLYVSYRLLSSNNENCACPTIKLNWPLFCICHNYHEAEFYRSSAHYRPSQKSLFFEKSWKRFWSKRVFKSSLDLCLRFHLLCDFVGLWDQPSVFFSGRVQRWRTHIANNCAHTGRWCKRQFSTLHFRARRTRPTCCGFYICRFRWDCQRCGWLLP